MTAELKKEFFEIVHEIQTDINYTFDASPLWSLVEQKIDEACKNAKIEECKYWQDYIFKPHVSPEQITAIDFALRLAELDNTSPKESEL